MVYLLVINCIVRLVLSIISSRRPMRGLLSGKIQKARRRTGRQSESIM
jgi:hypothetical protein